MAAGAAKVGLTGAAGTTNLGAGVSAAGAGAGAMILPGVVGAEGTVLVSTGGVAAGAFAGISGCFLLIIAFRTSPGLEM